MSQIEVNQTFLTVLYSSAALLIGWFLNEFKQILAHRREDRKVVGVVLADLLEIRYNLFTIKTLSDKFVEKFKLPPDQAYALRIAINNMLPHISETEVLQKRYSEAVTRVASVEPFLAFRLRGQNFLQKYLEILRSIPTAEPQALPIAIHMEEKMFREALPNLEELMRMLAKSHGLRTRIRVWRHLRKTPSLSVEMDKYFRDIEKVLETTMKPDST
jgi:hypothetical protein